MKTNKEKLIKGAIEVFKAYPEENMVIATPDGHYFLPSAKHLANDHARRLGGECVEILRSELTVVKSQEEDLQPEDPGSDSSLVESETESTEPMESASCQLREKGKKNRKNTK